MKKDIQVLLSKDRLVFFGDKKAYDIYSPITLNEEDPVLNEIALNLDVSVPEIVDTLKAFYTFFPSENKQ